MNLYLMVNLANHSVFKATLIGQISLIIWALAASCTASLEEIPPYEILSIICLIGFITSSIINTIFGRWSKITKHPKYLWLIGILGICGNDLFYILSFKNAPVIQADLIIYLWPILAIIGAGIFLQEKIRLSHVFACLIALYGIYELVTEGNGIYSFKYEYIIGYFYAFIAAIFWTIYILVSRKYRKDSPELFCLYYGIGLIIAISLHIKYETLIIPNIRETIILILMGTSTHGLAYLGWDYAIKNGDFKILSILSYLNPAISVMCLIFFGFSELTIYVIFSTICICIASLIGCINWNYLFSSDKKSAKTSEAILSINS